MKAIEGLEEPYQRTALLLVRWSGARRGKVRRLTIDCLDTYPDGYPRLRIPVGKTYTERMIPLHPQAAEALRELIELAKAAAPAARFDTWAQQPVRWVFMHRGQPMGKRYLFDEPLEIACHAAGLLDARGRPAVSAHRFRHTVGTQLERRGVASDATFREKCEDTRPALQLPRHSQRAGSVRQQCAGDLRCHHPVASAESMLQPFLLHPVTRMMRQMRRKAQRRGGMPLPPARQAQVFDRVGKPLPTSSEGGAQIQTIMAILGHRSASMAATYSHISDPVLREQYEKVIAAGGRVAGPPPRRCWPTSSTRTPSTG